MVRLLASNGRELFYLWSRLDAGGAPGGQANRPSPLAHGPPGLLA